MLEIRFLVAGTRLSPAEFRAALSPLAAAGWTPALREAERTFLRCAGLADWPAGGREGEDEARGAALTRRSHLRRAIGADLFFRDSDLFYAITKPQGRALWMPPSTAAEDLAPEVEVGLISAGGGAHSASAAGGPALPAADRLREFADALREACATSGAAGGSGLGLSGPRFDWRRDLPQTPRLAMAQAGGQAPVEAGGGGMAGLGQASSLGPSRLGLVELEYGRLLAAPLPRRALLSLRAAGFAREADLPALIGTDAETTRAAMDELREVGLVESEYLLECKQDRRPLLRAKGRRQLELPELAQLICPVCRGSYASETITAVYSVTEAARGVCAHSQWLRIWLTDQLTQLGVPLGSLLWREREGGEESDLVAEFFGRLWLFRIKDGDFTADDAYALNYRRARGGCDRVVLVTAGAVSEAARRVLREAEGGRPGEFAGEAGRGVAEVRRIEGLETARERLTALLGEAAAAYARQRLLPVEEITGFDCGELLRLWSQRHGAAAEPAGAGTAAAPVALRASAAG